MPCEKQLWEQLVQAAGEAASGLLTAFQYLQGGNQEDGARLLMLTDIVKKDNRHKLKQERSNSIQEKNPHNSSLWGQKQWKQAAKSEIKNLQGWRLYKPCLDKALINLSWLRNWPCLERDVGPKTFWCSFQTQLFYNPKFKQSYIQCFACACTTFQQL